MFRAENAELVSRIVSEPVSSRSTFDENTWVLDGTPAGHGKRIIYWDSFVFPNGSKITDPQHISLLVSCKTFIVLCAQGVVSRGRKPPRSSMVHNLAFNLRQFVTWMVNHDVLLFNQLTEEHIVTYRNHVRRRKMRKKVRGGTFAATGKRLSHHSQFTALLVVAHIVRLRTQLPFGADLSSSRVNDILWTGQKYESQKRTDRIPDDVFIPLVNQAIWWITEVGPKILARAAIFAAFRRAGKTANYQYDEIYEAPYPEMIVDVNGASFDVNAMRSTEITAWTVHTMIACFIVIAALTGMRASEILSLRRDCLRNLSRGGKAVLVLSGTLFKTSNQDEGETAQWVAGWDVASNPIRLAVMMLLQLNENRDVEDDQLFFRPGRRQDADGYSRASVQFQINRFAQFVGVSGWTLTPHQFRKSFARFVALASPSGPLALMRHFKHVSVQMTERYFPTDPELMDEIMDATLEVVAEKLDVVLGSEKLAGIRGAEILARNSLLRGKAGASERKRMTELTMLDPSARILLHVYGMCIYEESTARCKGDLENVGLNMCAQCPNLVIAQEHLPFWESQEQALTAAIGEIRTRGGSSIELDRQRERATENIRRLKHGQATRTA